MNRLRRQPDCRRGVTLLEVMTATAISATMMTSSFVLLRSSYQAWQSHEADLDRSANGAAVLRHLVQHARQAAGVTGITAAANPAGSLTVVLADGATLSWSLSGTSVKLSVNGAAAVPLADDIQTLNFVGYKADGVTPTTSPNEVHTIRVALTTQQPAGGSRTYSSCVWVRSW